MGRCQQLVVKQADYLARGHVLVTSSPCRIRSQEWRSRWLIRTVSASFEVYQTPYWSECVQLAISH